MSNASSHPVRSRRAKPHRHQRGLTTLEALVAATVVSTLSAAAVGNFSTWRAQLAVNATAAELETDLHFARSEALARQQTIHWTWEQTSHGTCWLVYSGPKQSCRCGEGAEAPLCEAGTEVLRSVHLPAGHAVNLAANARHLSFDATLGTVSPAATMRFSAPDAKTVHQVVGIMGRVRSCVPGGGLSGYRAC
jgi:type IV fimbrial biogenesis protein FimT